MIHRVFFAVSAFTSALALIAAGAFASSQSARSDRAPNAAQLAEAIWLEGRVVLPDSTPKDEKLAVIADAVGSADFDMHRVDVGADGHFKVAFAKNAKRGRVRLAARYLYLADDLAWKPGAVTTGLTLTPRLGALIRGRLLLPPNLDDATKAKIQKEIVGEPVRLSGTPLQTGKNGITRTVEVAADSTYEFGGLPTGYDYELSFSVYSLVPHDAEQLSVQPGVAFVHDIALLRGATVRGIVVDESEKPIAGALIGIVPAGPPLATPPKDMLESLTSANDGSFTLRGIAPGTAQMYATLPGYETITIDVVELADGETREGVKIPLREGRTVMGHVLFTDKTPAVGAKVHAVQDASPGRPPFAMDVVADATGAFRVTGLNEGRVRLTAMLEARDDPTANTPADKTKKRSKTMLRAALVEVEPNSRDVVLTLELGLSIEGHVLDDSARLVQAFTAGAMRADVIASVPTPGSHVTRDVRSADGSFSLDGLTKGDWYVYVYAKTLAYPVAQRITIPYTGAPLVFVMQRTATVSGVVLDKDGKAVSGAIVTAHWSRPGIFGGGETSEKAEVRSGHEGRFQLTDVYPGSITLTAKLDEGEAGPAPFTVKCGETLADVELRLSR